MSVIDKNKVFFGLIHYILSEQKNVDWIIKSSLIDFTGISSLLEKKPYKTDNILDEIIDYVKSIKPYHVQFSKYFEKYETVSEQVNIPKQDNINPTILQRFDRIQSSSDIILDYYYTTNNPINYLVSFEIIPTPSDSTVTIKSSTENYDDDISQFPPHEFNKNGLLIFSVSDMCFYERRKIYFENFNKSLWGWIKADIELKEGIYYEIKNDSYYVYDKEFYNESSGLFEKTYRKLSEYECNNILNYHSANRLYKLGLHNNEEITKELNANFKGLEINGNLFDVSKFGYDVFNYDTNDYDIPTIIYDYCIIDDKIYNGELKSILIDELESENDYDELIIPYDKQFTIPSNHQFKLSDNVKITSYDENIEVYIKYKNGEPKHLNEYVINDNHIDIFTPLGLNHTLYIIKNNYMDMKHYCQCIVSYPFIESDSDVIKRKYVTKNMLDMKFNEKGELYNGLEIPNSLDSSKLIVQLKSSHDGKRCPLENISGYTIKDNKLYINNLYILENYDHIVMTSFDYKYLYDKIYLWEDKYGRSNNIINLDGNNFLRAIYEKGRPSELVVSQPNTDLFLYKRDENNNVKIFRNDYKNNMSFKDINLSSCCLIKDIEYEDENKLIIKSLTLSSTKNLSNSPGKVIINSEIIEYNDIDYTKNRISKLKRGIDGSFIYMNELENHLPRSCSHRINDIVIPYDDFSVIEKNNRYVSYNVSDIEQYEYTCPSGVKEKSRIYVSKLIKINLLNEIKNDTTEIIIDSPCVVNSYDKLSSLINGYINFKLDGDFTLKINDDTIPFKSIYKIGNSKYSIRDFILPSKYDEMVEEVIYNPKTSFINSSLPLEIKQYNTPKHIDTIEYLNEEFIVEYKNGSMILDIEEVKENKKSSKNQKTNYIVKINETDNLFNMILSNSNGIFTGTVFNQDGTVFGNVNNNIVIKYDGTLYAKIEGNKFITIDTVIKLLSPNLHKKESIKINVVDDEFIFTEEEHKEDNGFVTLSFKTNPDEAILEIDCDDYLPIGNTISVPMGTTVKYVVTCTGYYDLSGEIIASKSEEILLTLVKEIIIENPDYIVLRYVWTYGSDLDTDTCFTSLTNIPQLNGKPVGWSRGYSIPHFVGDDYNEIYNNLNDYVCVWGKDNTQTGVGNELEENILLNFKNIFNDNYYSTLPNSILMNLSATWFSTPSKIPIKLEIIAYKGGEMKFNNDAYSFYNVGGEQIKITDSNNIQHDSILLNIDTLSMTQKIYKNCAFISINKNDKSFKLMANIDNTQKIYGKDVIVIKSDNYSDRWLIDKNTSKIYKSLYSSRNTSTKNVFVLDESNDIIYNSVDNTFYSNIYNNLTDISSEYVTLGGATGYYSNGIYSIGSIYSSNDDKNIYLTFNGHTNIGDTVYSCSNKSNPFIEYSSFIDSSDDSYGVQLLPNNNLLFKNIDNLTQTTDIKDCLILNDFDQKLLTFNMGGVFKEPIFDENGYPIYEDFVYIDFIDNSTNNYINGFYFSYPMTQTISIPHDLDIRIECSDNIILNSISGNATIVSQSENNLNGCVINVSGDFQMNVEKVY